jgi:hypothetical protein
MEGGLAMSDADVSMRARHAVHDVASCHPGLVVRSVEAVRGWGSVLYVTVHLRHRSTDAGTRRSVEELLRESLTAALEPERHSVSVAWVE